MQKTRKQNNKLIRSYNKSKNMKVLTDVNICIIYLPSHLKPFTNYPLIYNSISDPDEQSICQINPLSIIIPDIRRSHLASLVGVTKVAV